ncbi:MAG: hypothetical protein CMJ72_15355 [Planctomycetaceae bacterium]|nr:hypothetical protein [Planctomycetaceae bacterium]
MIWREQDMHVLEKQHRRRQLPYCGRKTAESVDVLSTRLSPGRTTSSPIEPKTDGRFGYW